MTEGSQVFAVPGMSCEHCVKAITDQVTDLEGVANVEVDLDTKTVTVIGGDTGSIVAAIDDAGFDVA